MKDNYDFTNAKKNPYTKKLKQQITIRVDREAISYFKELSEETGITYQNLINMYLIDCASKNKKLKVNWE